MKRMFFVLLTCLFAVAPAYAQQGRTIVREHVEVHERRSEHYGGTPQVVYGGGGPAAVICLFCGSGGRQVPVITQGYNYQQGGQIVGYGPAVPDCRNAPYVPGYPVVRLVRDENTGQPVCRHFRE